MTSRARATFAGTALLALVGLTGLAGCSTGSGGSDSAESHSASGGSFSAADGSVGKADAVRAANPDAPKSAYDADGTPLEPALIKRGTITLDAADVEAARLDARKVIDVHAGTIDSEETATDDDGEVSTVRMVVRVPAADFEDVVEQLSRVADLSDSSTSSTDVRDRVIHTHVQIGVQRDAIARIRELLSRATNIGDIIRIEGELTDRIGRLETLQRTAAYLADQTSMSTINLYIQKAPDKTAPPEKKKRTGFIGGLDRGWDAFTDGAVWLSAAVGAVLPFAVALAIVGLPLGWLLRRRARRPGAAPAVTPDAG
jgi:hypothetical protein